MIKLYQFPPFERVPDISPFCLKVETYLRIVGLDYESVYWSDSRKAPKGKLPFIEDKGEKIADSSFIIKYLVKTYPNDLDQTLSQEDHAKGLILQRTLEEHFYWALVYCRWMDERFSPAAIEETFKTVPRPLRWLAIKATHKKVKNFLFAQGLGRHSQEEIYQMGIENIKALAQLFGTQDFVFGSEPCSYDSFLFSFLAGLFLVPTPETPLQQEAFSHKNIQNYTQRMAQRYFPELLK